MLATSVQAQFLRACYRNQFLHSRSKMRSHFRLGHTYVSLTPFILTCFLFILSNNVSAEVENDPNNIGTLDEKVADSRSELEDLAKDAYRYAPRPDALVANYSITEDRLREVRSQFMYWFFDKGGNNNHGDYQTGISGPTPQIHKDLNFVLPFFGYKFNYTRVSLNGYLEFSDPPEHYTYPLVFPVRGWPKENDPSFIGIFFSKCRIGKIRDADVDKRKPGVYFRLERDLQTRTDQFGVEMRERVKWDIREGVVGSDSFDPKHAAIVTWKNVSFASGIDRSLYKTNSFQMVLVTDEVHTYVIFNYLDIQWTSHPEAGGDTAGGEGGVSAFIGFNAGNGTQSYEYQPYSQKSIIRDVARKGCGNGFPGRHIFRIDAGIMVRSCRKL